jgi:hypothetical protein
VKTPRVKVSFRLLNLDMMQAYTLKKEIAGASFYPSNNQGVFIGEVPLEESLFDELNDYFIRQQIKYDECDIFVRAHTVGGIQEVSVPRVVNKILKYIDCKLTYAFDVN